MPQPPKRPPVSPQARGGAVVSSRAIIAAIHTGEAVLPRALADRMGLRVGSDRAEPGSERTVIVHGGRRWGKSLALEMLEARRDMDPETFRREYQCVFEAHPDECGCRDCVKYRQQRGDRHERR